MSGRPIVLGLALASLVACHTVRFDVAAVPGGPPPITDRKSFFWWSLYPTQVVDMSAICPHGVAAVEEETTFGDGVFQLITLGIYSPRTSYYYCRPEPPPAQVPSP